MNTFIINITRPFKERIQGNYIQDLPEYLTRLFKSDDFNPISAFMDNISPGVKINIELTITVLDDL